MICQELCKRDDAHYSNFMRLQILGKAEIYNAAPCNNQESVCLIYVYVVGSWRNRLKISRKTESLCKNDRPRTPNLTHLSGNKFILKIEKCLSVLWLSAIVFSFAHSGLKLAKKKCIQ